MIVDQYSFFLESKGSRVRINTNTRFLNSHLALSLPELFPPFNFAIRRSFSHLNSCKTHSFDSKSKSFDPTTSRIRRFLVERQNLLMPSALASMFLEISPRMLIMKPKLYRCPNDLISVLSWFYPLFIIPKRLYIPPQPPQPPYPPYPPPQPPQPPQLPRLLPQPIPPYPPYPPQELPYPLMPVVRELLRGWMAFCRVPLQFPSLVGLGGYGGGGSGREGLLLAIASGKEGSIVSGQTPTFLDLPRLRRHYIKIDLRSNIKLTRAVSSVSASPFSPPSSPDRPHSAPAC